MPVLLLVSGNGRKRGVDVTYPFVAVSMKKRLSIIIPCYNEEKTIIPFLKAAQATERNMSDDLVFNYCFINDGSKDNTLQLLRHLSTEFTNVHYISFSRNFGKEAALLAGLEASVGDLVTVMDVDLQDPPELLETMYTKIKEGYDVVGTRRANRKGEPAIRSFFSKSFYWLINKISDTEMVDGTRDFRLMTRQVVNSILELGEVNRFSKGLFSWVGYDVTYISYENRERVAGQTSWSFLKLLRFRSSIKIGYMGRKYCFCLFYFLYCFYHCSSFTFWRCCARMGFDYLCYPLHRRIATISFRNYRQLYC